jgi:putative transposase
LRGAVIASDASFDSTTIGFIVMPDHFHWLLELGNRLSLGRVIARLKAQTQSALTAQALAWQRDFFEHRLRANESVEDYARYIYLNPYRATLAPTSTARESWWTARAAELTFVSLLNVDGTPPPSWISESGAPLITGE